MDELPPTANGSTVFTPYVDYMDIPFQGQPASTNFAFWITNYVWVTNISYNPYLRQITSVSVWTFPITGTVYTNTVVLLRAPDQ